MQCAWMTTTQLPYRMAPCLTATHIHEGRESIDGSSENYTHADLHNYTINCCCIHFVAFVFGVKQLASVPFLAAGP